ncbi:hypothetical protein B0H13DRAFT_1902106 [Mycena leptocephala]|nr:hypothetical protein B0H13DRAFT_1902106 [Mycena leptocephala]
MWSKSSSAAEAPGHRLEGDAAEGRGDETAMTVQGYADTVGSVRPVNGREGARDLGLGLGGSERGMGREELNWRHSLLLVLDMRWRPSPDDDDFEQMNQSQRNDVMVHNAVVRSIEKSLWITGNRFRTEGGSDQPIPAINPRAIAQPADRVQDFKPVLQWLTVWFPLALTGPQCSLIDWSTPHSDAF